MAAVVDALLAEPDQTLFVPITVTAELEAVLRCVYKKKRSDVAAALNALLSNAALVFEYEGAVEAALDTMISTKAGFPDALHLWLATNAGHTPFITMDKAASKLPGAQYLGLT